MADRRVPRPPAGLGAAGRALWRSIHSAVPVDFELDERDLAILRLAAEQADDAAALGRQLKASGMVVPGSQGQPRMSAVVTELRQSRLAVARLLGEIEIPSGEVDAQAGRSARSRRASVAAQTRWAAVAERRERARGA